MRAVYRSAVGVGTRDAVRMAYPNFVKARLIESVALCADLGLTPEVRCQIGDEFLLCIGCIARGMGSAEETILLVEDDDDVRVNTAETLRELGYRVLEAPDGPSAMKVIERHGRLDLLFTDVVLPGGMTGAQVAARAVAIRQELKVLYTTGYARNAIIHQGRLDKGVHLIVKPFSGADLAERVRDLLDGKSR